MNNPIFRKHILIAGIFLIFSANAMLVTGCRILKKDKQSVAEKKKAEADMKAYEEYEKASKQHYDIQTKETKKMMKKTRKKASHFNKPLRRRGLNKTKCN